MGENVATVIGKTSSKFISGRLWRFYAVIGIGLLVRAFLALLKFLHGLTESLGQFGKLLRPEHEHEYEDNDPPLGTGDVIDECERGHGDMVSGSTGLRE
jgi:hypothetical protein